MSECCDPVPYRRFFNHKEAERRLRRYRKRGLDKTAQQLVAYLRDRGVRDRSVLEVGGGIGDFHVELLKEGAGSAVNVELSGGYEETASGLMAAEGLTDRIERLLGDFVEQHDLVEPADIVVLNRVICCYPWMEQLLETSIAKTGWLLALAVPRDLLRTRVFVGVSNAVNRVGGSGFKSYVHPVSELETMANRLEMTQVFSESGLIWKGLVFERV